MKVKQRQREIREKEELAHDEENKTVKMRTYKKN